MIAAATLILKQTAEVERLARIADEGMLRK
jgi:hypothetical protein